MVGKRTKHIRFIYRHKGNDCQLFIL